MPSNLHTEGGRFILQQSHSFITEHRLCAWHGAEAEAVSRGRQVHSVVGEQLANAHLLYVCANRYACAW